MIDDDDDDLLANFKDIDVGSTSTTNTKAVNQKDASATEGGEGWGNESLDIGDDDDGVFNSGVRCGDFLYIYICFFFDFDFVVFDFCC